MRIAGRALVSACVRVIPRGSDCCLCCGFDSVLPENGTPALPHSGRTRGCGDAVLLCGGCMAGASRAAWSSCLACRCWPGRLGRRGELFGGLHAVEHVQEDLFGDHAGAEFPGEAGFS